MNRRARLCRTGLALTVAVVLAAPVLATPTSALAVDPGIYEHIWQAQTLFSGAAGDSSQTVVESMVRMVRTGSSYDGSFEYRDLLGVESGGEVSSQESLILLELTGTQQQGGQAAGGTFSGQATLSLRDASSLAEATDVAIRSSEAQVSEYDVSGHWGATVDGEIVLGELLFERIEGPTAPASGPGYFNRASAANPDMLGDPQLFSVDLSSPNGGNGGSGGDGDGSGGTDTGSGGDTAASSGDTAGTSSNSGGVGIAGVFSYILKGFSGGPEVQVMPVPDELALPARALRDATPIGATPLPDHAVATDLDLSGVYLDSKNRAAGLLDDDGPTGKEAESASAAVEKMRKAVPGVPAVPVDVDAASVWAERTAALLESMGIEGVVPLLEQIGLVLPDADPDTVSALRTWYHVAVATSDTEPFGTLLDDVSAMTGVVMVAEIPPGPGADAILASANAANAPSSAMVVTEFERGDGSYSQEDASRYLFLRGAGMDPGPLPNMVLSAHGTQGEGGTGLTYVTPEGPQRVAPDTWLEYVRVDDTVFWLAGEGGKTALTDGSLRGWAFSNARAALVDAMRVGVWLAVYPTG